MQQLIVDKDGKWFLTTAHFTFVDPISKVAFEPGVPVQVKSNDWIKGQPTIREWDPKTGDFKQGAPEVESTEAVTPISVQKPNGSNVVETNPPSTK